MKYLVISDSHDNKYNTDQAVAYARSQGITQGFHLGDIVAAFVVRDCMVGKGIAWQCVFGNNDGGVEGLRSLCYEHDDFDISGEWREIDIDGAKIYLTHYPDLARNAALTGKYQAVFYGHDHLKHQEQVGDTLLANPGELCGLRTGMASFGVWDSTTNEFVIHTVENALVAR